MSLHLLYRLRVQLYEQFITPFEFTGKCAAVSICQKTKKEATSKAKKKKLNKK